MRPPGSDWLFAKIYAPRALADDLIAGPLRDFAGEARAAGWTDGWFFLRYSDPDPHLRIRFHGRPARLTGRLLPALAAWAGGLMADGVCQRFSFDTYDREVERFGGLAGIDVAEAIFAADSGAVADLLALIQGHTLALDRAILAVLTVDDLLAGLGLDVAGRLAWCREQVSSWDEVGAAYRQQKTLLRALLGGPAGLAAQPGGAAAADVLAARHTALAVPAARLAALAAERALSQPVSALYRSFVHLHCNRLLGSATAAERRVLGLLYRTRDSLAHAPRTSGAAPL